MSKPTLKTLVTLGTEETSPLTATSTKLSETANRRRTGQQTKPEGGQPLSQITKAPEAGYQPTPRSLPWRMPVLRFGRDCLSKTAGTIELLGIHHLRYSTVDITGGRMPQKWQAP